MSEDEYGPLLRQVGLELRAREEELMRVRRRILAELAEHQEDKALLTHLPQADGDSVRRLKQRIHVPLVGASHLRPPRAGRRWWWAPVVASAVAVAAVGWIFLHSTAKPNDPEIEPDRAVAIAPPIPRAGEPPPSKPKGQLKLAHVRGSGRFDDRDARTIAERLRPMIERCRPPARVAVVLALQSDAAPGVVVSSAVAPKAAMGRFESCFKRHLSDLHLDDERLRAASDQLSAVAFVRFEVEASNEEDD